ncbi:Fc.00g060450.m01.CDS01 [Cosmosporella sp. VM-42]
MHLLCTAPFYGFASRLRNRLSPSMLKESTTRAAASVAASVRQSLHFNHRPRGEYGDKHLPKPAALGTKAMIGQVKSSVVSRMEHACLGERVRFRQQMSTIHQNWEQGNFLFGASRFP